MAHNTATPSAWVQRWAHLITPQSQVLDLACGHGRHMRYLASLGHRVVGVDRDAQAIEALHDIGEVIEADIENGPWPLRDRQFDAVVVTHYLWRPVWPRILDSLSPNGVLLYETFAQGNETVGKPSRPDFLLQNAELLRVCHALRVVAYEDGFLDDPARFVQRIVAVKPSANASLPTRYNLQA